MGAKSSIPLGEFESLSHFNNNNNNNTLPHIPLNMIFILYMYMLVDEPCGLPLYALNQMDVPLSMW